VIRVVAIDDEPLALRRIELMLDAWSDVDLVATAGGCDTGRRCISEHRPDVVLLDIKMRDGSGLTIAEELAAAGGPPVIFLTAFNRFAVRAFDLAAVDYVLKPADPDRLRGAIGRARLRAQENSQGLRIAELQSVVEALRADASAREAAQDDEDLWVRKGVTDLVRLAPAAIDWIEADGGYVRLHVGERSYLHRCSLSLLERNLATSNFVRVHRAALVRVGAISEIRRTRLGGSEVILLSGTRVPTGRVYGKALRRSVSAKKQEELSK